MQSIDESVYVAQGVQLYGKISVGAESALWPNVVIRAEANEVRIGRYTNLQDFVMVHIGYGNDTVIGDFVSITHHSTIHGCTIEDDCLIGINAVIMDGAVIGRGSIVAGGAMVTEAKEFPPNSIIAGVPAKLVKERDNVHENRLNAWQYHYNAQCYKRGHHRAWEGPEYEAWLVQKRADIAAGRDTG
jgi:carbonic anhydrase/acetyltransferase-like protein (isoleucine patch superfamily)